jgi:hypothetical protein
VYSEASFALWAITCRCFAIYVLTLEVVRRRAHIGDYLQYEILSHIYAVAWLLVTVRVCHTCALNVREILRWERCEDHANRNFFKEISENSDAGKTTQSFASFVHIQSSRMALSKVSSPRAISEATSSAGHSSLPSSWLHHRQPSPGITEPLYPAG